MRKILPLLLFSIVFLLNSQKTYAQLPDAATPIPPTATPTPTIIVRQQQGPSPTPYIGKANCDACGYCEGNPQAGSSSVIPGRWQDCRRCLYPALGEGDIQATANRTLVALPSPDPFHYYTDFGCISTVPGEFATQISSFFFSIVGGIAFLFFLYGAGVITTSRSDPARLNYGKRIIYGSIIGLLFAIFSVFILRIITTGLGLPGFS